MNYEATSQLLDARLQTATGSVEQLLLSNPPAFVQSGNKSASTLIKGSPVAVHSSGSGFVAAQATSTSLGAFGILVEDAPSGFAVSILTAGLLVLANWSSVAETAALQPRAIYYLSTTAGRITATAPTVPGQIVQVIGVAVSPVALSITMEPFILL